MKISKLLGWIMHNLRFLKASYDNTFQMFSMKLEITWLKSTFVGYSYFSSERVSIII